MAKSDASTTFDLNLETNAGEVVGEADDALEAMQAQIEASQASIKGYVATLRMLRGTTDEVKKAKDELKAKLAAERDAVSKTALALTRQGKSYDEVARAAKKKKKEEEEAAKASSEGKVKAMTSALRAAGGPVAELSDRFAALKSIVGGGGSGGMFGGATLAAAGLVAVLAAITVAAIGAAASLASFILQSASATRSMQLAREAAYGNAKDAAALGTQVDALARRIPLAKTQINDMAVALSKAGFGGQTLVDALQAVEGASAAVGDDVGSKLKSLLEAGRIGQRFALQRFDLMGTGIEFDDVAKSLAASMKVGVADARRALVEGRVSIGAGAEALRRTVESKFGSVNARKMLDLEVLSLKFKETLQSLTKNVNIEPILKSFAELSDLFSSNTQTGLALRDMVTAFSDALGFGAKNGTPLVKALIQGIVIGALQATIAAYKLRNAIRDALGNKDAVDAAKALNAALYAGQAIAYLFASALMLTVGALALVGAAVYGPVAALGALYDEVKRVVGMGWDSIGKNIIDGLTNGMGKGGPQFLTAVTNMGDAAKAKFKEVLGIHSPSKVFEDYGRMLPRGAARGVDAESSTVQASVDAMAPTPTAGKGGAAGGGGNVFHITIQVMGGGKAIAEEVQSPTFIEQVTKVFEMCAAQAGLVPQ